MRTPTLVILSGGVGVAAIKYSVGALAQALVVFGRGQLDHPATILPRMAQGIALTR